MGLAHQLSETYNKPEAYMSDITLTNYQNYLNTTSSPAASSIEAMKNKDLSKASDEELMDACKEFESYFMEMVMKEMTKNIHLTGEDADSGSSTLVDFYKDQTISKLASQSTEQNSLGLAQQMYEQMKRSMNGVTADEILAKRAAETTASAGAAGEKENQTQEETKTETEEADKI